MKRITSQFISRETEHGKVIDLIVTQPNGVITTYQDVQVKEIGFSPLSDEEKFIVNKREWYRVIGIDSVGIEHHYTSFVPHLEAIAIVKRYNEHVGKGHWVVARNNVHVRNLFIQKVEEEQE